MHRLRSEQIAGLLISTLAITVMVGWWSQQQMLVQLLPGLVAMVFNTALCFLMAGTALLLPTSKPKIRGLGHQAIGTLIVMIAGSVGLQNIFEIDLKIDRLLVEVWFTDTPPTPGACRRLQA